MKRNRTTETEILLSQQTDNFKITPDYVDDDLIVIDNVKLLGMPDAVYTNMNLLAFCKRGKCQISRERGGAQHTRQPAIHLSAGDVAGQYHGVARL